MWILYGESNFFPWKSVKRDDPENIVNRIGKFLRLTVAAGSRSRFYRARETIDTITFFFYA